MGYEFLDKTKNQIVLAIICVVMSIITHYFIAVDLTKYPTIPKYAKNVWKAISGKNEPFNMGVNVDLPLILYSVAIGLLLWMTVIITKVFRIAMELKIILLGWQCF